MAHRPPKPCPVPGCQTLVAEGYCVQHAKHKRALYKSRDENRKFYSSSRWQTLRGWFIRRNPLCAICMRPAHVVDHKLAIKDGGDAMTESNLQSLCNICHQRKRGQEAHHIRLGGSKSLQPLPLDRQPRHTDTAAKSGEIFNGEGNGKKT
jgi:5-methylcytosine-specific restriction protein A